MVEAAFVEELEGFLAAGPTEVELEASLAQSERSWLSALASQEERADLISPHVLLHDDPQAVNTHLDRLRAVTAEQVTAAARRWLRPRSRAVVAYLALDGATDADRASEDATEEAVA
jgi:zinc protease